MMHHGSSVVLPSYEFFVNPIDQVNPSMYKHQSELHQHSDSSRSSSFCSSSLSSPIAPSTVTTTTAASMAAAVPRTTSSAAPSDIDPQLAQHVEYELGLTKKPGSSGGTRKNAWGNLSYAELISKAITTSAEERLTLSEIYDWMIKYVPFFRNKVDRVSSAGWKNSIRHNLSLHNRFKRVQSEGTGKSSWWMINPDEKNAPSTINDHSSSTPTTDGIKQPRRRAGHNAKSTSSAPKRQRTTRLTKPTTILIATEQRETQQQQQQISPSKLALAPIYESQPWNNQVDGESSGHHLYEHDFYATSISTPLTNSNTNSTGNVQSTYPFEDIAGNYPSSTSSNSNNNNNNNNNTSDYSYHHSHSFHPHSLYHPHHNSNYEGSSNNIYYESQPLIHDPQANECLLPLDTYPSSGNLTYSLQTQQPIDGSDDPQIYLRVPSTPSHSSSASLSPPSLPTLTKTSIVPLTSSIASSSSYSYSQKNGSLSGAYHHPTPNGPVTLYSHHHHHHHNHQLHHHPHHSDMDTLLHLNGDAAANDDEDVDDLSTLVHHPQLSSLISPTNHQLLSHHPSSTTSILTAVLTKPIVGQHLSSHPY